MKDTHIKLTSEQKDEIKAHLKKYFTDELETELSNLESDILIDFLTTKIGKYYYNVGVTDTITSLKDKTEDLVLLIRE